MRNWMLRAWTLALVLSLPSLVLAQCETCDTGCETGACETGCPGGCEGGAPCGGTGGDPSFCGTQPPAYPVPFATPRPTVPTYLTYAPLYPHHSLPHYNGTYSYRHNTGLSRTNVNWTTSLTSKLARIHHIFYLPR